MSQLTVRLRQWYWRGRRVYRWVNGGKKVGKIFFSILMFGATLFELYLLIEPHLDNFRDN